MKGINAIHLNKETMITAMQEYINRRWTGDDDEPEPTVTDVEFVQSMSVPTFVITLCSKADDT